MRALLSTGSPRTKTLFTGPGEPIEKDPSGADQAILEDAHTLQLQMEEAQVSGDAV